MNQRDTEKRPALETENREVLLDRPSFMADLGLLPPYELVDIETAYHDKVLVTHSDHGGDPADFIRLKQAYDLAVGYVKSRGSRRTWIAEQVESHLQQEEVIAEVIRRGGRVELERSHWIEKLWGDGFPLLAEYLRHVYVREMADGDRFLAFLTDHRLPNLIGLDVAESRISGEGLRCLASFENMRWLDVSGTDVDYQSLRFLLSHLPSLEWLNVRNTRLGWWRRWQLRRLSPQLRVVTEASPDIDPGTETMDFHDGT